VDQRTIEPSLALVEQIESAADSLLIELLAPAEWDRAVTGSDRAALPGFGLVSSQSDGGPAVGFVHVIEVGDIVHLEQLSVLPSCGRRGHGSALVEAAKLEASSRGKYCMTLRTFADVLWNAPFYATCGFVESELATEFHRQLVQAESSRALHLHRRRIEMITRF
ncbi:MAG: GNAT family N-acetyltransferase, partial [Aeromicrobium sp.]